MVEMRKTDAFSTWLDGLRDIKARAHVLQPVGLWLAGLQIRLRGPYFRRFLTESAYYRPANRRKSGLAQPAFRLDPQSPTGC